MGLKGLTRQPAPIEAEHHENNAAADAFISAAPVSTASVGRKRKKKAPTYVRTTFSLSKDLNKQIDKLSLTPRNFRATRSDVVRAGVLALLNMERPELLALLENASKAEPIDDVMQDE